MRYREWSTQLTPRKFQKEQGEWGRGVMLGEITTVIVPKMNTLQRQEVK